MKGKTILIAGLLAVSASAAFAASGFLTNYDNLQPQASQSGTDLIYVSPGGEERLAVYSAVMVDQPEIHFSSDSEYRGLKSVDVEAIAALLYENLVEKLKVGGYTVVEQAGADALYLRTALSELYLKKKKRGLMSFTPVGRVVKIGKDALSETLDKVDIIEITLEAELADSLSGEVLGAVVLDRGARKAKGQKEQRMDMDELRATVQEYGGRLSCRLQNSRMPVSQRIDCNDPAARMAREQS